MKYPAKFYVYAYIRSKYSATAKAGTPYYIGRGKNARMFSTDHNVNLPRDLKYITVIKEGLTWYEANDLEIQLIRGYGRTNNGTGILRNRTDGGEGARGWIPSKINLENMSIWQRMDVAEFISRVSLIHNRKYDYSLIDYKNAHTKVAIICPTHGTFYQQPLEHLYGKCGCPNCGNINGGIKKSTTAFNKFLEHARKYHNNKYEYVLNSFNGITKRMKIICPIHGIFEQSPDVHKRSGCQKCGDLRTGAAVRLRKSSMTKDDSTFG